MVAGSKFASVRFSKYRALKDFSITLRHFNVLVGPNNSGKSTILSAFRILTEGMRRARARKPELLRIAGESQEGYRISLENLPISTENVFTNYDEDDPARIEFRLSDGNGLEIVFPEVGSCYLVCKPQGKPITAPSIFNKVYL